MIKEGKENERMSIASTELSIPVQLNDFNLRIVKAQGKAPCEREWQTKNNYPFSRELIGAILRSGLNYGFTCTSGFVCFIDADFKEIQEALDIFSITFRYSTGRIGHFQYLYFIDDEPLPGNIPLVQGAYVKTKGGFTVGPGSVHPETGRIYGLEVRDVPVAIVKKAALLSVLAAFLKREETKAHPTTYQHEPMDAGILHMEHMIDLSGFRKSGGKYQGSHPIHGSDSGSNFTVDINNQQWHCFRCDSGGGPLQWIAVAEGIIECSQSVPGALRGMTFWQVIAAAHDRYGLDFKDAAKIINGGNKK